MTKLLCLLIGHQWRLYSTEHYVDTSYGRSFPSCAETLLCDRCLAVKTKHHYGDDYPDDLLRLRRGGWSKHSPRR